MPVSIQFVEPSPIAAVVVRTTFAELPAETQRCRELLYAAANEGKFTPDGFDVAIYRRLGADGSVEATIGVQVAGSFTDAGPVRFHHTPAGRAATVVHFGAHSGLPSAHTAIMEWAEDANAELAGVSWEVFGEWSDDPGKLRTDVFHLLAIEPSVVDYDGS